MKLPMGLSEQSTRIPGHQGEQAQKPALRISCQTQEINARICTNSRSTSRLFRRKTRKPLMLSMRRTNKSAHSTLSARDWANRLWTSQVGVLPRFWKTILRWSRLRELRREGKRSSGSSSSLREGSFSRVLAWVPQSQVEAQITARWTKARLGIATQSSWVWNKQLKS